MKKLIFLGPPGAGKGTIASVVAPKLEVPHISTGDMFREALKKETELGLMAKEYMDSGKLVPDDVTVQLLKERISRPDCENGFILDGFPRTINQAEELDKEVKIDRVINLEAPEEVIVERLSGRRTCKHCGMIFNVTTKPPQKEGVCDSCGGELYQRDDQKAEVIKKRLQVYNEETHPLVEFYEKKEMLKKVSAVGAIAEIAENAVKAIEE